MTIQLKFRMSLSHSAFLFLTILLLRQHSVKAQDFNAPITESDENSAEAIPDIGLCKDDALLANTCGACAALPSLISLPVEWCCNDEDAITVCGECLDDPVSCLMDVVAIENAILASMGSDEDEADSDDFDNFSTDREPSRTTSDEIYPDEVVENTKRYGTLFLGKRPLHFITPKTVQSDVMKRHALDDVTGPTDDSDGDIEKRWGTLGLGSKSYGRYARLYWIPANQLSAPARNNGKRWESLGIGKRWGSLGIGNGKRWGSLGIGSGKRWGSLGIGNGNRWGSLRIGKRWGSLGIGDGKRWGTLGIGKKWGTLGIGKRWGSLGIGGWKRWGSLGLGTRYRLSSGKRWGTLGIGKRSAYPDGDEPEVVEEQKRWGSLGLSRGIKWGPSLRGKRWGSLGLSNWRKRWGLLGLGQGKRWGTLGIDKRKEMLTALDDDNENFLDSTAQEDDEDKRWGTLNIGKRETDFNLRDKPESDAMGDSEDKRWGTLSFGKRWGNLGGFGGFKRWGYVGLGFRKPSSNRRKTLGKRSADVTKAMNKDSKAKSGKADPEENRDGSSEMTDPADKKWGSLGIGNKGGFLGFNKKWGSLGIGKKWGSLGIGTKWGTLHGGKKWGSLGSAKKWDTLGLSMKKSDGNDS